MSRLILTLLLLSALVACTGETTADDPTTAPTTASEATAMPTPTPTPTPTPSPDAPTEPTDAASAAPAEGAVDDRLAFVLGLLNGAEIDEETYTDTFAQVFRDELTFEQFTDTLDQITPLAPYTLGEERARDDISVAIEATGSDGTVIVLTVHVDAEGQIDGLFFAPGDPPTLDEPVSSLQDAVDRLSGMGQLNLLAATVSGGECTADLDVDAAEPAPIGSAFKLYVLGAVVDAIDAGELAWTDQLTITDDIKSLPSGVLQDRDEGTQVTVAEAAEVMIAISDNTATDLLLHAVGREAVEQAQAAWGHSAPQLNMPMLTTRELFILKAAEQSVQEAWVGGDETVRRAILTDLEGQDLPPVTTFTGAPIRPDTIEWFASPEDLCGVLARLHDRFENPAMEPLAGILTANPGIPDEAGRWEQILFKGGSEPGLVTTAFLVTDADGGAYALTGTVLDPTTALDDIQAVLLMGAARDLLPITTG